MISILDYGLGNLRSVQKAFEVLGFRARLVTHPGDPVAGLLVLPGVGNFADAMARLHELGLVDLLRAQAAAGRPVLGVCLGMQLLFDASDEDAAGPAGTPGLGLIPGRVVALAGGRDARGRRLKVPQMGWNRLSFAGAGEADDTRPTRALEAAARGAARGGARGGDRSVDGGAADPGGAGAGDPAVYFVHGYHARPEHPADILATTDHGGPVVAIAGRGRVLGMQFHPEKSQAVGLALLRAAAEAAGERAASAAEVSA